jgi:hypothetical protein
VIPVEVTQTPWHYTTFWDWLDHWQTLIAGLTALLAAFIAVVIPEWRARKALRASLAGEIRLYVDLLIEARCRLTKGKEEFRSGKQTHLDLRDWTVLPPPVVYPAAADRLGHVRRPSAANVVEFYANIERANFTVRALSNKPTENVSVEVLIDLFEVACRTSLPLLSEFPFDKRDAEFRATISKWDAERPQRAAMSGRAMRALRALIVIGTALACAIPAHAQTMTCSTSFQGYRVCQDSHGYRSTEWDRDGMRFGQDNQGDRWTTSRWRDMETTTITPPRDAR